MAKYAPVARFEVGDLVVIDPDSEAFEYGGDAPYGGWVVSVHPNELGVQFLGRCEADPDERQDGRGWVWAWPSLGLPIADIRPMTSKDLHDIQRALVDAMRAADGVIDKEVVKAHELLRDRIDQWRRFCGRRLSDGAAVVEAAEVVLALPAPAPTGGREARELAIGFPLDQGPALPVVLTPQNVEGVRASSDWEVRRFREVLSETEGGDDAA